MSRFITLTVTVEVPDLASDDTVAFATADALRDVADSCDRRGCLPPAPSAIGSAYTGHSACVVDHTTDVMFADDAAEVVA